MSWLSSLPSALSHVVHVAERVAPLVNSAVAKVEATGKRAVAMLHEDGSFAVKAAGEEISHLVEAGFHQLDLDGDGDVDADDAKYGLTHALPGSVVDALDRADDTHAAIQSGIADAKKEFSATVDRIAAQRDKAVAELNSLKAQLATTAPLTAAPTTTPHIPRPRSRRGQ